MYTVIKYSGEKMTHKQLKDLPTVEEVQARIYNLCYYVMYIQGVKR